MDPLVFREEFPVEYIGLWENQTAGEAYPFPRRGFFDFTHVLKWCSRRIGPAGVFGLTCPEPDGSGAIGQTRLRVDLGVDGVLGLDDVEPDVSGGPGDVGALGLPHMEPGPVDAGLVLRGEPAGGRVLVVVPDRPIIVQVLLADVANSERLAAAHRDVKPQRGEGVDLFAPNGGGFLAPGGGEARSLHEPPLIGVVFDVLVHTYFTFLSGQTPIYRTNQRQGDSPLAGN